MQLDFEYGNGFMKAALPDSTDVFIHGEKYEVHFCQSKTF